MANHRTLSRQLASFAASLNYEDLPPPVTSKLKGLLLHGMVMSIVGAGTADGRSTIALIKAEEGREHGATILVDGSKATRGGAAFANSKLMHITNQSDSYRMLTHPGPHILPAALASAEVEGRTGRDLLIALAAAYEVAVRIPGDYIPTTQARGFRSSPVYGVFGAAVATSKLLGLNEDQMTTAIALACTFAGGTAEGQRTSGQEIKFHEPNAARNGVMAGLLARQHVRGAETALEGDAGFYNAFTGNNRGDLTYVFEGDHTNTPLRSVVEGLGERYELLNVTPKIYPTAGYNNPVIELMASIKHDHPFDASQVDHIDLEMNWLETLYPSPAFPNPARGEPGPGSTQHYLAYTCVHGHYPLVEHGVWNTLPVPTNPLVDSLMRKVTITGRKELRSFAPRITVHLQDGSTFGGHMTGDELKWDWSMEVPRVREVFPHLPLPTSQLEELVSAIENLEALDKIAPLLQLTVPPTAGKL